MPDTVTVKGKTYKLDPMQQHQLAMGVPVENVVGPNPGQGFALDPTQAVLPVGAALGAGALAGAPFIGAAATTHPLIAALAGALGIGGATGVGHALKGLGGGGKTPGATTAAPTSSPTDPYTSPLEQLLTQILAGQSGAIPQGYESFFKALGGGEGALMGAFNQQLGQVKGANPNMVANYQALNQAQAEQTGPEAQGLQQFVLGPLANQQKLTQALVNALGYLPYTSTGLSGPLQTAIISALTGSAPGAPTSGVPVGATPGAAPPLLGG